MAVRSFRILCMKMHDVLPADGELFKNNTGKLTRAVRENGPLFCIKTKKVIKKAMNEV